MDSKEVKNALKNAREAIRNKEFKEALRHCKTVLASDKTNYNALVFVGVAAEGLEQADQALKAYKKAIDAAPEQILAWQGLCGFYEKNPSPDNDADLASVYKKLMSLQASDKEKMLDIGRKLAQVHGKLGNVDEAVSMYRHVLSEDQAGQQRMNALMSLFDVLHSQKTLSTEYQELMLKTCKEAVSLEDLPAEGSERLIQQYLELLVKQGPRSSLWEECRSLHDRYPANLCVLETWTLLLLEEHLQGSDDSVSSTLRDVSQKLGALSVSSPYVSLSQGVIQLADQKLVEARDLLQQGMNSLTSVVSGYVFLARCHQQLHTNMACVEVADKGLKALEKKNRLLTVPSKSITCELQLLKATCLYRIGSPHCLAEAREILSQDVIESPESRSLLVYICLKQGNIADAQHHLGNVPETDGEREALRGRILFHTGKHQEALTRFEKLTEDAPDVSGHQYMLGRVLWQLRDTEGQDGVQERCFKAFLKAAKLDPYNSDIFLYLGHFYATVQKQNVKAKRCYQKAYDLDPANEEAGAALCDILVAIGEDEEARALLEAATSQANAGCGKWAWLRLGLYQVRHDDPTIAVASFQAALRADPRDNHVWECLAEAYLHRGSYTAALKTFTKAAELNPESVYSLFQIASIKQTLGEYPEAVAEYKTILEKSHNYVPALKGLGETLLLLARQHLTTCLDGLARDKCQEALVYLTRAASQRADLSCLWKLMGDACTVLQPLAPETFSLQLPAKLVQQSSQDMVSLGKMEVLQVGARCYGRALKSIPESASLWHDLGVNYFHQSELSTSASVELSQKAIQALKKAISLDPNNFRHWNALGVVVCAKYCYKPELAQHCFIKSIEVESNNVVAWTNLGTLYLKNDNVQLAHEAFKVAQSLDPSYVACWIGQALIAEIVGHDDAMDLFRHTTELGSNVEGAVGYASWVCQVLQDRSKRNTDLFRYSIKQMAAIPAASDALARYTGRVKTDMAAYNMYGLLLEHQKLYGGAAEAFRSAVEILEKDSTQTEQLGKVRINYGRVLCKGGNYKESVEQLGKAGSLEKCEDLCFHGLAHYKLGRFEDSYQAYNMALGMAELDEDKSHIYSALGMVAYRFGDVEGAKTALFNGSQQAPPSALGLQALCSLGLLQSDATLATAAIQELFKLGDKDPSLPDVTWLSAAVCILQGNLKEAKRSIQRVIQKNPSCPRLWRVLSSILSSFFPDLGDAASHCARASQDLAHSEDKSVSTLLTVGQLQGGLHSRCDTRNNALSSAQKALHLHPDKVSNQCSLIAAVHAEAVLSGDERRRQLLNIEQQRIQGVLESGHSPQPGVALWCWRQRVVSLILSNKGSEAKEALQQFSCLPTATDSSGLFAEVLEGALTDDLQAVQGKVCMEGRQLYLWQVLTEMYLQKGLMAEADTTIRHTLQLAQADSQRQVQLESLLKLASLSYQQIMSGSGDKQQLRSVFDEAAAEVLKIDPGCSAVLLMMGALSIKSNKVSRRHYQRALIAGSVRSSRGHDVSLARQAVIRNIIYSQKDLPLAKKIADEAVCDGDEATVNLYSQLKGDED
ncbi:superkiller complex protein 3-like [Haliotis cracherodii]|uniref:superkiller complex protein 3-like n=1 Tax=Haliotis cracherodii TaxID=6455 RepID=UPI0039EBB70F